MGLFDRLRNELVDVIEWVDDSNHTLVWRFPRFQNEIKNGAQLIVRPGQTAVFVQEGAIADVFSPGRYELTTNNLPILTSLKSWKYGFNSPFKAEVYFVSTRQITDMKWGTPNPVMLRDADFGPIRLRAFGTYALRCTDPKALLKELVGTDGRFETDEVAELMRALVVSTFSSLLGESKIAALDLAQNYRALGEQLRKSVLEKVDDEYGLDVPVLTIVNVSFPEEVEKALDTRTKMGVLGDMRTFQQMQMGEAILAAAHNPGGGMGANIGAGLAMAGQMMGGAFAAPAPAAGPPPLPTASLFHVAVGGASQGPLDVASIQKLIAAGQVSGASLAWTNGMAAWAPASTVPGLGHLFAGPPPLPKQ